MIHPHFVTPYRLDDQSALFTPRNDRVYSHYEFPVHAGHCQRIGPVAVLISLLRPRGVLCLELPNSQMSQCTLSKGFL
jgi:hypothetical protein